MDRLLQPWKYPSKDKFSNRPIWAPRPDLNQTQVRKSQRGHKGRVSPEFTNHPSVAITLGPLSITITITTHGPIIGLGSNPPVPICQFDRPPTGSRKSQNQKWEIATNHPSASAHGASVAVQSNRIQLCGP